MGHRAVQPLLEVDIVAQPAMITTATTIIATKANFPIPCTQAATRISGIAILVDFGMPGTYAGLPKTACAVLGKGTTILLLRIRSCQPQTSFIWRGLVSRSDTERDSPECQAKVEGSFCVQEPADGLERQTAIS